MKFKENLKSPQENNHDKPKIVYMDFIKHLNHPFSQTSDIVG